MISTLAAKETYLCSLFNALHKHTTINVYDFGADELELPEDVYIESRTWAHMLVREKLAQYADEEKTTLQLTNYGRYWMLRGGYENFLYESGSFKNPKERQQKLALLDDRIKLTHYRLFGFWITLIISLIGLASLGINIYLLLRR